MKMFLSRIIQRGARRSLPQRKDQYTAVDLQGENAHICSLLGLGLFASCDGARSKTLTSQTSRTYLKYGLSPIFVKVFDFSIGKTRKLRLSKSRTKTSLFWPTFSFPTQISDPLEILKSETISKTGKGT